MTPLASCHKLSKSFSGRPLFQDISLTIASEDRLGLIGANGSGKSTLLKILAGLLPTDGGEVALRKGCRLVYQPQDDVLTPEQTVSEAVDEALGSPDLDLTERQVRVQRMLRRAGFDDLQQPVATLSGGWRKRLSLCRALVQEPDLLLLDEPTNHLDLEGILWLEDLLRQAPFAFVLVTHDRYLLERCARGVIELSRRYPDGFLRVAGAYSDFLAAREARLEAQAAQDAALSNKVRREVEWLRRGPQARATKARARIDEAGRLIDELQQARERSGHDRQVQVDFDATGRRSKRLLWSAGLSGGYGDRALFRDLEFVLGPGHRLGLLGRNGAGKSTLLRILAGEASPLTGTLERAPELRVLCFEQDRSTLDPTQSLRRALAPEGDSVVFRGQAIHVAGWAARFLFRGEQLDMPVASLSGGEQARILIARLMLQPADVLLLDEPTNDLDIPSLEVLESSLGEFPGALVLVTHDRYLMDRVCTGVLGLDGQGGWALCAEREQWLQQLAAREAPRPVETRAPKPRSQRPTKLSYMEERELGQLEVQIPEHEALLARLNQDLQRPEVTGDPARLRACVSELDDAQRTLDALYARWEALELKREGG
ncbi:MAG: ABC-F family ATP-binding cassette domain-containing protein [Pseudomonadota bacterium]